MDSKHLYSLIHNAWDCYIHTPLCYSNSTISEQMIEQLSWFVCTSMEPSHKTIILGIDKVLAQNLAGVMFDCPASDIKQDDIKDAIGEIANIIAGSVKSDYSLDDNINTPVHLKDQQLLAKFSELAIDAEVLALSDGMPFYTALVDGKAINSLASSEVLLEAIEPVIFSPQSYPCVLWLLADESHDKVRSVCILDLKAACILGGALEATSEDIIHRAISQKNIPTALHNNCERILKDISATLHNETTNTDLQLTRASVVQRSFPKLESLLSTPEEDRVDFEIAVIGYGQGTLTIVAS